MFSPITVSNTNSRHARSARGRAPRGHGSLPGGHEESICRLQLGYRRRGVETSGRVHPIAFPFERVGGKRDPTPPLLGVETIPPDLNAALPERSKGGEHLPMIGATAAGIGQARQQSPCSGGLQALPDERHQGAPRSHLQEVMRGLAQEPARRIGPRSERERPCDADRAGLSLRADRGHGETEAAGGSTTVQRLAHGHGRQRSPSPPARIRVHPPFR